jgi:hypothetical protein
VVIKDAGNEPVWSPGRAYVDEHSWLMLVEWGVRIAVGLVPLLAPRRPAAPHAAARALQRMPAGSEVGGTLPDGSTWYVRVAGERR